MELRPQTVQRLGSVQAPVAVHVVKDPQGLQGLPAVVQQPDAVGAPGVGAGGGHDHGDQPLSVPNGGGAQAVARLRNGARLEAVDALVVIGPLQQLVGVLIGDAVEGGGGQGGVLQHLGEALDELPDQDGLGPGGDVVGLGAVAVFIGGLHAQPGRRLVHPLDKGILRAGHGFRQHPAGGAGRRHEQKPQQRVHRQPGAGLQRDHRGILAVPGHPGVLGADGAQAVQGQPSRLQLLKDQIGGHHLGHGGGHPHGVGVLGIQELPRLIVHDHGAGRRDLRRVGQFLRRGRPGKGGQQHAHRQQTGNPFCGFDLHDRPSSLHGMAGMRKRCIHYILSCFFCQFQSLKKRRIWRIPQSRLFFSGGSGIINQKTNRKEGDLDEQSGAADGSRRGAGAEPGRMRRPAGA